MTTYNDQLAAEANIVTERIAEKAPGYNYWPDFPVLKIEELDTVNNPNDAFRYGFMLGGLTTYRQVRFDTLPKEIRSLRPETLGTMTVNFTAAQSAGQSDPVETRNLLALFPAHTTYNPRRDYPALFVTIGCVHDYDRAGSNPRRGYNIGRCRKCGHRFVCDSGD